MPGKAWRVSELKVITDSIRAAKSPSEIRLSGRTPGAIRAMASRLNLIGDGISRKRWPEPAVDHLRRLVAAGWSAKRIAESGELSEYGRNAIQKQMQRLGLGRPERSLPQKAARRLCGKEMDAFCAFLEKHAARLSPAAIADLWNGSHAVPVTTQRVLYHLGRMGVRTRTVMESAGTRSVAAGRTMSKVARIHPACDDSAVEPVYPEVAATPSYAIAG